MKENNIIQNKSFTFAVRIVKAVRYLQETKKEYILTNQLIKSGTSIGANIEEAIGGHSKADFISKLTIAYKEARETKYWIMLLKASEYLINKEASSLLSDIEEILKLLGSILKTSKNTNTNKNS